MSRSDKQADMMRTDSACQAYFFVCLSHAMHLFLPPSPFLELYAALCLNSSGSHSSFVSLTFDPKLPRFSSTILAICYTASAQTISRRSRRRL